jgi:hypothetical protein
MRKGRPVLGAIFGLILGGFVALDLQQYAIRPLDNVSIIGLPFAGLVVGLALGILHPLRPGRGSRPASPRPASAPPAPAPAAMVPPAAQPAPPPAEAQPAPPPPEAQAPPPPLPTEPPPPPSA